jgi:hypothetical protein
MKQKEQLQADSNTNELASQQMSKSFHLFVHIGDPVRAQHEHHGSPVRSN